METKFTPGPWHFVPENAGLMMDHGHGLLYGEPDICTGWEKNLYVSVGCSGNVLREFGEGVAEANARLIAAAPDLYEALVMARGWIELAEDMCRDTREALAQVDAAIAKATGESA